MRTAYYFGGISTPGTFAFNFGIAAMGPIVVITASKFGATINCLEILHAVRQYQQPNTAMFKQIRQLFGSTQRLLGFDILVEC